MTDQKPIEPLPSRELVQQWRYAASNKAASITGNDGRFDYIDYIATQAAQWGYEQRGAVNEAELQKARDEELEACCEWIGSEGLAGYTSRELRAARRPKPKSQAEEALEALNEAVYMADDMPPEGISTDQAAAIRAALERLRELEEGND